MKRLESNRMRLVIVGIVVVIIFGFGRAKADFTWTERSDMPTPRWGHTSAVVNGKIYIIGGVTSQPNAVALATVEEYDPVTNTWTRKADMPIAMADFDAPSSVVDGKIYVIGVGGEYELDWSLLTVQEYDPSTDTWTRKADMPTPRWMFATVDFEGKVYAIGGYPPNSWVGLKTVEVYDPATDTWARKADMPLGVALLNARVVKGKIYAIGGRPNLHSEPWMQEYDTATDTWTRKADMPVDTSAMGSVVLDDKIFVIGGWEWSMDYPYTTMQVYDPQTDTWTREADVPFLRAAFSAEVVNNRIYVIGGTDRPHPCPATSTVYEGIIQKSCDFNGDGIVDSADVCIMVDYWGTNEQLCDIGPMPWDGIVDVEDLKVLSEHLFEQVEDPTLIAHWAFDETEGMFAADSVGDNDAVVLGGIEWQPDGGQIDGALKLDGVSGYAIAGEVLNPADGPFGVIAWIKGGAPGQVIVSQQFASNWLATDADGNLITELKSTDPQTEPLFSEKVIADGQWHRIGLVWDGSHRTLYIDGVVVAEDTQDGLEGSEMGLNIGAGKMQQPGTFFSGMIDDVRIYNRVVSP